MIVELELKDLIVPQGLLPRVLTGTVEEKVKEYAEMLEQGVEFDPILVWRRNDGSYWIVDGVHRTEAHKRAGKTTIKAKLVELKDELEYRIESIKANLKHGLPLQKEERVILAQTLYKLGVKIPELRKIFGVSERTLYYWLESVKEQEKLELKEKALELRAQGLTQEEVAERLGVPRQTISRWEREDNSLPIFAKISKMSNAPETQSQKEEIDWKKVEEIEKSITEEQWQELREMYEEMKTKKVGRPKEEKKTPPDIEEWYRIRLEELLIDMGLKLGWIRAFEIASEIYEKVKEFSKKAVRGW